ncbi:tRNA (adenosine(37)-N6)-dimethylallyltransferase MiaA [Candidatus Parcubacteria bacterium]|nr:MAG: tRNA (adenosine(37)-N6)-dimethylallyltransferase MiaA [Candidatus Parcubacteria bacterium]
MNKVLFVVGPTASGKTSLALDLAPKINGVILNADSRQVYKGLDIISGKDIPDKAEFVKTENPTKNKKYNVGYYKFNSTPVYLLDLVTPTYEFNVYDYLDITIPTIDKVIGLDKIPIVVGGTGFYIKALLDGIATVNIPQDKKLRKRFEGLQIEELQKIIKKKDPEKFLKMNESDFQNKRRLIRAIEIAQYVKKVGKREGKIAKLENMSVLIIGLTATREIINERIDERVEKRITQGALDEAKKLFDNYKNLSEQVKTGGGYRDLFEYLKGNIALEEAVEKWKVTEHHIAKKQIVWFQKDKRIKWFDITENKFEIKVKKIIDKWLK